MTVDEKMIAFANRLADASGSVIRPFFRQRIDVADKPGMAMFDPVTEADKGAERAIRAIIERDRPQDAILGEEYGEKPAGLSANKWRWVLDPVDGTRGFITGRHEWGSLIALEHDEVPVLGILDQPVLGERFIGVNGKSVLVSDGRRTPLKVRECADVKDAVLCVTDPFSYFSETRGDHKGWTHFDAFPSGHTATAFAAATILSDIYQTAAVTYGSYALATAVGISRITEDTHWASDVFVGALLGYYSAKLVEMLNNGISHVRVEPLVDERRYGVKLGLDL